MSKATMPPLTLMLLSIIALGSTSSSRSSEPGREMAGQAVDIGNRLLSDSTVKAALAATERHEPWVLEEQRAIL